MTLHSILIQKLLSTNAHLGRSAASCSQLKQFAYGIRNSRPIIDSDKTLICLRHAIDFIAALARDRHSRFLFVNTNPIFNEIVETMTKTIGLYTPRDNIIWRKSGFLTNSFSPKKFKSRNRKFCLGLVQHPDCIVVVDTELKSSVIREADKMQIPIVALVDPSLPGEYYKKIAYPIPANHSMEFVYLFCNIITKTILLEKKNLNEVEEDDFHIKPAHSDEVLGKSKDQSKRVVDISEEVFLIPYSNLAPAPSDLVENRKSLEKLAFVQLNETLGTSMGYNGPKSTIEIRNGMSSLDLSLNHVKKINSKYDCSVPVLLMSSKSTKGDTKKVLEKHEQSSLQMIANEPNHTQEESLSEPRDALQMNLSERVSKLLSLVKGESLDLLSSQGKEIAYICTSDNVAPSIDLQILNHMIEHNIDCCIEVVQNRNAINNTNEETSNWIDSKSICSSRNNKAPEKVQYIDTGNMWVNLMSLRDVATTLMRAEKDNRLFNLFNRTMAVFLPHSRDIHFSSTSDLLLLRSDLYDVVEGVLVRNAARKNPLNPSVDLGVEFQKVEDLKLRLESIPSFVDLDSLKIDGDVWFGPDVTLKGDVKIVADFGTTIKIPTGAVLENQVICDPADI